MDSMILFVLGGGMLLLALIGGLILKRNQQADSESAPQFLENSQPEPSPSPSASQPTTTTDDLSASFAEEIRRVAQSRKIEAIKQVREHTGWDLKTSKQYVDDLLAQPSPPPPPPPSSPPLTPDFEAEIRQLAQKNKIEAIKQVREKRSMSLKAAKEYVESLL